MKTDEHPEGFEIPIHRSLTQTTMYWGGVPRTLLILEAVFAIFGGIILKTWLVPVLAVCCHFLFRFFGQHDPDFHLVFMRSKDYGPYYYP